MTRRLVASAALLGALALVVPPLTQSGSAGAPSEVQIPAPLLYSSSFADPTIVESLVGLVGAATAPDLKIARSPADAGPWGVTSKPALTRRPTWATSREIWAPDIQRGNREWLMYFAAGVAGADPESRCIGVARSHTAFGPYTPVGSAPLVCPVVPGVPTAADVPPARELGRRVTLRGVIDPSSFLGRGKRWLVYRTQGQPSTIRLVQLTPGGARIADGQHSRVLTRFSGIEENPVMVRRGRQWVLFTSVGWFGNCAYRTYWRRSPDLQDWSRSTPRLLLSTEDRLCGPGGADVLQRKDGATQIYFHAWTCFLGPYPCPANYSRLHPWQRKGVRALYGATLGWTAYQRPYVESWIAGVLPQPPTPTPTPTPDPSETPTPTVPTETVPTETVPTQTATEPGTVSSG